MCDRAFVGYGVTGGSFHNSGIVYGGRLSVRMCFSHEVCMVVSSGVVSLGSYPSSVVDGKSRVALIVSKEVWMEVLGSGLSPLDSLAMMTLVNWMRSVYSSLDWRFIVMRLCQLCSPTS